MKKNIYVLLNHFVLYWKLIQGFPGSSKGKESACTVEDPGLIHGLGRSPGEGNGNPLQYSCLENPNQLYFSKKIKCKKKIENKKHKKIKVNGKVIWGAST